MWIPCQQRYSELYCVLSPLNYRRLEPSEVFRSGKHEGKFSDFDAKGIPTMLEDGSEVPEKQKAGKNGIHIKLP
jgi:hypothetical protein